MDVVLCKLKLCRGCGKKPPNRPRGLCWTCYYTPEIRNRFPSVSKFGRVGPGHYNGAGPTTMPQPTSAMPGTPEKIAVLEYRVEHGLVLHHPLDGLRRRPRGAA